VGVVAAATRTGATWAYPLPSVLGALAGAAVLVALVRRFAAEPAAGGAPDPAAGGAPDPAAASAPEPPDRRRFLYAAGGALVRAAVAGVGGRWLAARRGVSAARASVTLPAPESPA